jgi:hypothetical protein
MHKLAPAYITLFSFLPLLYSSAISNFFLSLDTSGSVHPRTFAAAVSSLWNTPGVSIADTFFSRFKS